jgi:hypothetical protein
MRTPLSPSISLYYTVVSLFIIPFACLSSVCLSICLFVLLYFCITACLPAFSDMIWV